MTAYDMLGTLRSASDLEEAVHRLGILPFFRNGIPGYSVEEHVPRELWFTDQPGPWEWKGEVILDKSIAYGKFFERKAAFVDARLFPDLANYRRDGYDFDARYDDGLANRKDKTLYDLIVANEPVDTRSLKRKGDYRKGGSTGFDTSIVRLQMQAYVLITDFVYAVSKGGMPYGWGISRYATPEQWFGQPFTDAVYACSPQESRHRLESHLMELFPSEPGERLSRFLG